MTPEAIASIVQAGAIIAGGFYFTGRVTAMLDELRRITIDHEDRLRSLEHAHPNTQSVCQGHTVNP